jgi:hypothetical protein
MPIDVVIDSAHRNFRSIAPDEDKSSILFIADPDGIGGYGRFLEYARKLSKEHSSTSQWKMLGEDDRSVTLRHISYDTITAVKGQQLITDEGLEVLAVGLSEPAASGQTLTKTIDQIRRFGGLSILAWGAGKWIGRRGRLVTACIRAEIGSLDVMLADNGGRPAIWWHVPQFDIAREHGLRILAGSDPLPLAGEERRVGSYGFRIAMQDLNQESVIDDMSCAFKEPDASVSLAGRRVSLHQFISSQAKLRLRSIN